MTVGRRARLVMLVVTAAGLTVLTGCTGDASSSPPSGVDGLMIPTPTPSPGDFVAAVDNPWFPLPDGARWVYLEPGVRPTTTVTRTAGRGPVLAGVTTTALRTVVRSQGRVRQQWRDLYAQDTDGNVWWFGHQIIGGAVRRDINWTVEDPGAHAGLVISAAPRLGDGYQVGLDGSAVDVTAEVVSLEARSDVPGGHFTDEVALDVDDVSTRRQLRYFYARGVGLTQTQTLAGGSARSWRLLHASTGPT